MQKCLTFITEAVLTREGKEIAKSNKWRMNLKRSFGDTLMISRILI